VTNANCDMLQVGDVALANGPRRRAPTECKPVYVSSSLRVVVGGFVLVCCSRAALTFLGTHFKFIDQNNPTWCPRGRPHNWGSPKLGLLGAVALTERSGVLRAEGSGSRGSSGLGSNSPPASQWADSGAESVLVECGEQPNGRSEAC
jgi:hypothetical protein